MKDSKLLPIFSIRAFTLVEVLVVVAILGILAALLFPSITGSQNRAKSAKDAGNLRAIGSALALYAGENNGQIPVDSSPSQGPWFMALEPYLNTGLTAANMAGTPATVKRGTVWEYPLNLGPYRTLVGWGYGINAYYLSTWQFGESPPNHRPIRMAQVAKPSQTVFAMGSTFLSGSSLYTYPTTKLTPPSRQDLGGEPYLDPNKGINVLFLDGSVQYFSRKVDTPFYHKQGGTANNPITQGDQLWDLQ